MAVDSIWNRQLLKKYGTSGPRYTSYPTANHFHPGIGTAEYRQTALASRNRIGPISLYIHIPFCRQACFYCGCNRTITRDRQLMRDYIDALCQEIRIKGEWHGHRRVRQMHWGGGTPSYLDPAELTQIMHALSSSFELDGSASRDYSIEVDPRTVDDQSMALFKGLGFNRVSLGVQDFDSEVQLAINRVQDVELVASVTESVRRYGFDSLNFDLIYGLPRQNLDGLQQTLEQVIDLAPDRIACYHYAHMPERFSAQRAILASDLPTAGARLRQYALMGEMLSDADYEFIGMDHFARAGDELCAAARDGSLQRNFQGYSRTLAEDLIGLGASAISQVGDLYAQNEKHPERYMEQLGRGVIPVVRGFQLDAADRLRRAIIQSIVCQLRLNPGLLSLPEGSSFQEEFALELDRLKSFEEDGLVQWDGDVLEVTPSGRLVLRNLCMLFDAYLPRSPAGSFSKII